MIVKLPEEIEEQYFHYSYKINTSTLYAMNDTAFQRPAIFLII